MLKDEFLLRECDDWPLSRLESEGSSEGRLSLKLPDIRQELRSESELQAELRLLVSSSPLCREERRLS